MKIVISESQYKRLNEAEEEQKVLREVLKKSIETLLGKLVSPKYNLDIRYDISFEKHDDTGEEYAMVDAYIDREDYIREVKKGNFHSEVLEYEIRDALKYLGITKSYSEVLAYVKR